MRARLAPVVLLWLGALCPTAGAHWFLDEPVEDRGAEVLEETWQVSLLPRRPTPYERALEDTSGSLVENLPLPSPASPAEVEDADEAPSPEKDPQEASEEDPEEGSEEISFEEEEVPAEETVIVEKERPPPKPPIVWKGRLEFGVNGSEGNSRTSATRLAAKVKRKTKVRQSTFDLYYLTSSSRGELTEDELFLEWRHEATYPDSPWSCFLHGTTEYDEFTAFDSRVTMDAGVGYEFFDTEAFSLQGRVGGGASREFGGPMDEYVPETSYGLSLEMALNDRHKISAQSDIFPDVRDFNDFRARSDVGWEILIDEDPKLSLRISGLSRYDSTPGDKGKRDLTWAALLAWEF